MVPATVLAFFDLKNVKNLDLATVFATLIADMWKEPVLAIFKWQEPVLAA